MLLLLALGLQGSFHADYKCESFPWSLAILRFECRFGTLVGISRCLSLDESCHTLFSSWSKARVVHLQIDRGSPYTDIY